MTERKDLRAKPGTAVKCVAHTAGCTYSADRDAAGWIRLEESRFEYVYACCPQHARWWIAKHLTEQFYQYSKQVENAEIQALKCEIEQLEQRNKAMFKTMKEAADFLGANPVNGWAENLAVRVNTRLESEKKLRGLSA